MTVSSPQLKKFSRGSRFAAEQRLEEIVALCPQLGAWLEEHLPQGFTEFTLPANNPVSNSLISLSCTGGSATFNSLTVSKLKSAWWQPESVLASDRNESTIATMLNQITSPMEATGAFVAMAVLALGVVHAQQPDIAIADFEAATYGSWMVTGAAFGSGPADGTLPNQMPVRGFRGSSLVNSYCGGDDSTGTLTSQPFKVERKFIQFLIGGGG